jgi:hypothetical protein
MRLKEIRFQSVLLLPEHGHEKKKPMKTTKFGIFVITLYFLVSRSALGQNTIQFNAVNATEEGAIRLSWVSNSNEVYQIQCADTLIDTNTGLTPWRVLYDQYPSQGTNTFWLDTGNYDADTIIPHPKYSPMRFYRILSEGTNDGEIPSVVVTAPTNGSVLSDQITVSVTTTSSYPELKIKLFVDGQEMNDTDDGTNFVINTCEWPNGPHTLFATAIAFSARPGPSGDFPVAIGRAVSSYVPVTFSNLITKVAFSQAFFEPSLGQTQEVTATFGANVDWTLQIVDDSSNAVRTVTGTGGSLVYDWDGTGDGGTNIPDGVYYYQISAATNGLALPSGDGGSDSTNTSPPPPSPGAMQMQMYAIPSSGGDAVPLAIYPPGMDTNNMTLFEASPSEMMALRESLSFDGAIAEDSGAASPDFAGPSAQTTAAPTRPPTAPVKNQAGNYGVGYYSFLNGRSIPLPGNGITPPLTQKIHLDGNPGTRDAVYGPLTPHDTMAIDFIKEMKARGWKLLFHKFDDTLSVNSIRRGDQGYSGGQLFTQGTIGLFMSHGSFGTDPISAPAPAVRNRHIFQAATLRIRETMNGCACASSVLVAILSG